VAFDGVDIDAERINHGVRLLAAEGIENVRLQAADAAALSAFPTGSRDIVLSCALCLYVPPEQIEIVLREMLRVARQRVILMEQHRLANEAAADEFILRPGRSDGYWIRDYQAVLRNIDPTLSIEVSQIPAPRWPAEKWKSLAHLIEINL
jgi:ubiquinone/menaquinone biosynthesis C-methylase UbiE